MSVYIPKRAREYWFDFWRGGQRFRGPTGKTNKRDALKVERVEKRKAAEAGLVAWPKKSPKKFAESVTAAEALVVADFEENLELIVQTALMNGLARVDLIAMLEFRLQAMRDENLPLNADVLEGIL